MLLSLDLGWVRFAPLTSSGIVIAGAALGLVVQSLHTLEFAPSIDLDRVERLGLALLVILGLVGFLVTICVLAVVGYLLTNFGFVLSHTGADGSWHLRRGLFTTRETTLDDARVSGVSIGEPLGLRLAGGARLSAIVTGLDRKQKGSSVLVPPAPRAEVDRVAEAVLRLSAPVTTELVTHGRRRPPPPLDPRDGAGRRPGPRLAGGGVRRLLDAACSSPSPCWLGRRSWPTTAGAAWVTPWSTTTWSPAPAAWTAGARRCTPRR